jgi:acetolactate synthase-1/2/3 large subunit
MMRMTGAEIIVTLLKRQGIHTVTGIPGGANLPLYDELGKSDIRHILARHEQGAAFIAQGMARSTREPAVCLATSGPGATNLVTAIADAHMDSVPLIAITGQVPRSLIGTDAFQEVDICGVAAPFTKHTFRVRHAAELLHVIPQSFAIAVSDRPGPVLIDIPKDVQTEMTEFAAWPAPGEMASAHRPHAGSISRAAAIINASSRPVLYVGGGVTQSGAAELVRELAARASIPAVATLMALGVFPSQDRIFLGMPGMHGERSTNLILEKTDCIIAIGTRFDDRVTGPADMFCPQATIIHIDIDPAEINKIRPASCPITADADAALDMLLPMVKPAKRQAWHREIQNIRRAHPSQSDERAPLALIASIGEAAGINTIVITDVGQHQMWTAQAFPFRYPGQFITSGGFGTMGFGLPAAIGAALMHPDKLIVCFTGDGSLFMNMQELATLAELQCNIKVFILNNNHLGLVRQQQELFYNGNITASRFEVPTDFVAIAKGFGLSAARMDHDDDMAELLHTKGPFVMDIPVDEHAMALPMVPPGAPLHRTIGGSAARQLCGEIA